MENVTVVRVYLRTIVLYARWSSPKASQVLVVMSLVTNLKSPECCWPSVR